MNNSTSVNVRNAHNSGEDETFILLYTVTDPYGATASDTVTLTVSPEPNNGPTANAGPDQLNLEISHNGDDLLIMRESDILAVL